MRGAAILCSVNVGRWLAALMVLTASNSVAGGLSERGARINGARLMTSDDGCYHVVARIFGHGQPFAMLQCIDETMLAVTVPDGMQLPTDRNEYCYAWLAKRTVLGIPTYELYEVVPLGPIANPQTAQLWVAATELIYHPKLQHLFGWDGNEGVLYAEYAGLRGIDSQN